MELKKELHKGDKVAIASIVISIIVALALYSYLPDQIASHWNMQGIADGFMAKDLFIAGFPALMAITYLALSLLPKVRELKYEMDLLHHEYASFKATIITFLSYVYLVILYSNSDFSPLQITTPQLLFPGISVLLYYVATVMPRLKRNHFIGIRTPWTIHSDTVWEKTHKLGSKLFKALSVIVMFATLVASGYSTWLVVAPILAVGIILVAYSYKVSEKTTLKTQKQRKNTNEKKTRKTNSKARKRRS